MDEQTRYIIFEKWKNCPIGKLGECKINVTNSYKECAYCLMCKKNNKKKDQWDYLVRTRR